MTDRFATFRRSLPERRTYRHVWGTLPEHLRDWGADMTRYDVRHEMDTGAASVTGSSCMRPPRPDAARILTDAFGDRLPADLIEFYRTWDGGLLFHAKPGAMLGCEDVVDVNQRLRREHGVEASAPWRIIRLVDIRHDDWVGMVELDGRWYVGVLWEHAEKQEVLAHEAPYFISRAVPSFSEWLDLVVTLDTVMADEPPITSKRLA